MNELINILVNCLIADIGDKEWLKIEYILSGVSTFWQENAEVYLGYTQESIETTDDDEEPENSPMHYAKKLRETMCENSPNKGAWYTMRLIIQSTGKFDIQFDYDNKPEFNIEIDKERYVCDFEKYPRDTASTPAWLTSIIEKDKK